MISKYVSHLFSNHLIQKMNPGQDFFPNVVGYQDIKQVLFKCLKSKEPIHVLLTGPPSTSKTVFLLGILDKLSETHFVDGLGVSAAGMVDYLFNNDTKYLLIDEIDKLKMNYQAALLNVMETGILSETKLRGKTRQKKMKLWVIATSNSAEKLSDALRSRFMEFHLQAYTFEEFAEISRRLLKKKYKLDTNIADKISNSVWFRMKSSDIRDVIKIAKLTHSYNDVDWLIEVQIKYRKENLES